MLLRVIWSDICYRFRCAFYPYRVGDINRYHSAKRYLEALHSWKAHGLRGAWLFRVSALACYYILLPVWRIRGY
jgi:hypothetical protein